MTKKTAATIVEILPNNSGIKLGTTTIHFHRTLRLPDDGKQYPLPPSLGSFPVKRVEDYLDRVPTSWKGHGGVFLPMDEREALWMSFDADAPAALKVGIGLINAVTGKPWQQELDKKDQDYMVVPRQPWLDGIKTEGESIRQFIAMAMGGGYTVEGQVSGEEKHGGIQLLAFPMKAKKLKEWQQKQVVSARQSISFGGALPAGAASGAMPHFSGVAEECLAFDDTMCEESEYQAFGISDPAPAMESNSLAAPESRMMRRKSGRSSKKAEIGLGAGGRMKQKIYEDEFGVDSWDQEAWGRVFIHIVTPAMYADITGESAPTSTIDAQTYAQYGYPWFDVNDKDDAALPGSDILNGVKTVKEIDAQKGKVGAQDDTTVNVAPKTVVKYPFSEPADPFEIVDGQWGEQ
jgi:hypothetical protein